MESRMDTLYVIHNKSYHNELIVKLLGHNPLANMSMEAVLLYCPADPSETRVLKDCSTVCCGNTHGAVMAKYIGRTTVLY